MRPVAAHSATLLDDRLSLTRVRQPRAISRSLALRPSNGVARSPRIAPEDRREINHCQRKTRRRRLASGCDRRRSTNSRHVCNDTICRKCNMRCSHRRIYNAAICISQLTPSLTLPAPPCHIAALGRNEIIREKLNYAREFLPILSFLIISLLLNSSDTVV